MRRFPARWGARDNGAFSRLSCEPPWLFLGGEQIPLNNCILALKGVKKRAEPSKSHKKPLLSHFSLKVVLCHCWGGLLKGYPAKGSTVPPLNCPSARIFPHDIFVIIKSFLHEYILNIIFGFDLGSLFVRKYAVTIKQLICFRRFKTPVFSRKLVIFTISLKTTPPATPHLFGVSFGSGRLLRGNLLKVGLPEVARPSLPRLAREVLRLSSSNPSPQARLRFARQAKGQRLPCRQFLSLFLRGGVFFLSFVFFRTHKGVVEHFRKAVDFIGSRHHVGDFEIIMARFN